jgi:hypothetical protein
MVLAVAPVVAALCAAGKRNARDYRTQRNEHRERGKREPSFTWDGSTRNTLKKVAVRPSDIVPCFAIIRKETEVIHRLAFDLKT